MARFGSIFGRPKSDQKINAFSTPSKSTPGAQKIDPLAPKVPIFMDSEVFLGSIFHVISYIDLWRSFFRIFHDFCSIFLYFLGDFPCCFHPFFKVDLASVFHSFLMNSRDLVFLKISFLARTLCKKQGFAGSEIASTFH